MNLLLIFWLFFKIGLFTIGGGLAAIPLLRETLVDGGWVSGGEFIDMLAVSQSTPGPIGINMATYAGFKAASFPGALAATAGMVAPSLIIIMIIARFLHSYAERPLVRNLLSGLRPTATGLIAAAAWFVFANGVILLDRFPQPGWVEPRALLIFAALSAAWWKFRVYPVVYILAGGVLGALLL